MLKDKITVPLLRAKKDRGEKIVMLTCYDYPSARLLDEAGIDIIFVGDSVGDNVLGYKSTIPVTMDEIAHHCKAVRRGTRRALLLADMPFLSFQVSPEDALRNAGRLMKEAGVEAVKIEGGGAMAPTVEKLVSSGVPVMGHTGLTPQFEHVLGGKRPQGKDAESAERILDDARALVEAGVFALLLEVVPSELARRITEAIPVPTIGIGAGPYCDGQVLVLHDLVGMYPDRSFRHVKRYADVGRAIRDAAAEYAEDVRAGRFPTGEHSL